MKFPKSRNFEFQKKFKIFYYIYLYTSKSREEFRISRRWTVSQITNSISSRMQWTKVFPQVYVYKKKMKRNRERRFRRFFFKRKLPTQARERRFEYLFSSVHTFYYMDEFVILFWTLSCEEWKLSLSLSLSFSKKKRFSILFSILTLTRSPTSLTHNHTSNTDNNYCGTIQRRCSHRCRLQNVYGNLRGESRERQTDSRARSYLLL